MSPRPHQWSQGRKYGVVIDAGSSGSRIQVYSWVDPEIAKKDRKAKGLGTDVLSRIEKGVEEGDGWHLKVEPGTFHEAQAECGQRADSDAQRFFCFRSFGGRRHLYVRRQTSRCRRVPQAIDRVCRVRHSG